MQITPFGLFQFSNTLDLLWSGSGFSCLCRGNVTFHFESSFVKDYEAYLALYMDDVFQQKYKLNTNTTISLSFSKPTKITFLKITEKQYGTVSLTSITGHVEQIQMSDKKKILWIGDSLSAGYGTKMDPRDIFTTENEDIRDAYTYLTTQLLQMDGYYACYSGNGIISRYIEPDIQTPRTDDILPSLFPLESTIHPDYIIINLGTNDASYTRSIKSRNETFAHQYISFIHLLKDIYPNATLLITYGMMETSLLSTTKSIASSLAIPFYQLEGIHAEDPIGILSHPSYITHQRTAHYLSNYLQKEILHGD